jgi:futalosine hydrolase
VLSCRFAESDSVAEADWDLDFGVRYAHSWEGAEQLGFGLLAGRDDLTAGNRLPTDPELTRWLSLDGRIPVVTFGTSDSVSGDLTVAAERRERFDLSVESMEGAAAAQTAAWCGVPFAQVRGISNVAGQRDKASWEIRTAIRAAVAVLVAALRDAR